MGKDAASSSDGTSNTSRFACCLVVGFAVFPRMADEVVCVDGGFGMGCGIMPGVVARDALLEDVFDRCCRCPPLPICLWPVVACGASACVIVFAGCSCKSFALTSAGFAIADFCGSRGAGAGAGAARRSGTLAAFFTVLADSVLLRCTIGRFTGGVDETPNSSSEGTSKTSGLAVAARAFVKGCADFVSPPDPAGGPLGSAECLCGRSGEGASSSRRLGRGGGRRDNLPYVMTFFFFCFSPVVKVDAVNDAMFDAFIGVVMIWSVS
jgi:hypothetical protein